LVLTKGEEEKEFSLVTIHKFHCNCTNIVKFHCKYTNIV
jgi:hypothetical protein